MMNILVSDTQLSSRFLFTVEDETFDAHSLILMLTSSVFNNMFMAPTQAHHRKPAGRRSDATNSSGCEGRPYLENQDTRRDERDPPQAAPQVFRCACAPASSAGSVAQLLARGGSYATCPYCNRYWRTTMSKAPLAAAQTSSAQVQAFASRLISTNVLLIYTSTHIDKEIMLGLTGRSHAAALMRLCDRHLISDRPDEWEPKALVSFPFIPPKLPCPTSRPKRPLPLQP